METNGNKTPLHIRKYELLYFALTYCIGEKGVNVLKAILDYGVDPNAYKSYPTPKKSPLFYLCGDNKLNRSGSIAMIQLLIDAGIDVNHQYKGKTALDIAKESKSPHMHELVSMLTGAHARTSKELSDQDKSLETETVKFLRNRIDNLERQVKSLLRGE